MRFSRHETVETIETIEPIEPRNDQFKTIHANSLCLLYVSNTLRWDVLETFETLETLELIETTLKRFSETIETVETRHRQFRPIHMQALRLLYGSNSLRWDVPETLETLETLEPIETTLQRISEAIETVETRHRQFTTIRMQALHLLYGSTGLQLDVRETPETIETLEPR